MESQRGSKSKGGVERDEGPLNIKVGRVVERLSKNQMLSYSYFLKVILKGQLVHLI